MKNRKFTLVIAVMMAFSICAIPATASAKSLSEINKNIKSKQSELKKQKDESEDLEKQIASTEKKIKETEDNIKELDSAISNAQSDLSKLETELAKAEKKVKEQNTDLNARLRSMYKNGTVGFIDVLLQSGDFSEFLTNLSMVQRVFKSDEEVLSDLQKAHDTIETKTTEIKNLKSELSESKELADKTKSSLKTEEASLDDKKDAINSDIAQTQKEIDKMEAEAQALTATIKKEGSSSKTSTYKGGVMCWPAPSYTRISCYFGWRTHPITGKKNYHGGTDLAAPGGSPILAAESGTVIIASYHYSYGNYVVVDHGGGICTLYAHSSKLLVSKGQKVKRGQKIALVGTTGSSTGNHLHFEVRKNGVRVNGLSYIQ